MFKRLFARLFPAPVVAPAKPEPEPNRDGLRMAAIKAQAAAAETPPPYRFKIEPPKLAPGVAPAGVTPPVMAMDAAAYTYVGDIYGAAGFPGYPYLANLATRAEFRAFAQALSTELTREWIELTSAQGEGQGSDDLKAIEAELTKLGVRGAFQKAAEHDCYFGRSQLFVSLRGHDDKTPLILSDKTVGKGDLLRVTPIEPMWTTPSMYSALDPSAPDFYRPTEWFMLGRPVHASRLLTVVTRELPDMLKPAFNFGGMSLSQLAEPYVDNWLRTRQSVSDLINNFSITALATSMDQVLSGADNGTDLFNRATLFTQGRSNKGLMLLDKEREELVQMNTPLGGLHELQAQSQEQMCSVSRMPAIVLTGISPGGLNASSDSEIRIFYDWIAAQQEAHWRGPLEIIIKLIQLSLFGKIDPDIGFKFVPLYQMTAAEESDIRSKDATSDTAYINAGVLDPSECRERLARDPNSGYQGLDLSKEIVPPTEPPPDDKDPGGDDDDPPAQDADFNESDHPRDTAGKFGKGVASERDDASTRLSARVDEIANKFVDLISSGVDISELAQAYAAAKRAVSVLRHSRPDQKAEFEDYANKKLAALNTAYSALRDPPAQDDWQENKHPRDKLGQFGKGGAGPQAPKAKSAAHVDAVGNQRSGGLSKRESKIEGNFYRAVDKHTDKLVSRYKSRNGWMIDPDKVKELDPDFRADSNLAGAVHEPSSKLAKIIFKRALEEKAAKGDTTPTVFTAGGSGSGKSTTLPYALKALGAKSAKEGGLIYDSVLSNPKSAKSRIDQALAATKGDVAITYTNADIEQALVQNALRSRSVTIDTLMHAHVGASDTLRQLAEHYKDNPRVKFNVMNNRGTIDQIAPGTIADVPEYERFTLRNQLVAKAQEMLDDGVIDKAKFEHLTR